MTMRARLKATGSACWGRRRLLAVGIGLAALGLVGASPSLAAASPTTALAARHGDVSCKEYKPGEKDIRVSLAPDQPPTYTVYGALCATPGELRDGTTVQLLLHGAMYDHNYWDFGTFDGLRYSYATDVAAAGFPTFMIDQIGAGASSRPPSSEVTVEALAFVAHQLVQGLKGLPGGAIIPAIPRFGKVIAVGDSLGSSEAWQEAISYQDVDGLIATGRVHHLSSFFFDQSAQDFYPAIEDPKFQDSGLDPGYFTTRPGTRTPLFFNPDDADPAVIAADEARKDVFSSSVFPGYLAQTSSTATQAIRVPVLAIVGSKDAILCEATYDCSSGTAIAQLEAPYYSPEARLQACSVPGSGHHVSLHLNHWVQEAASIAWSYGFVGQNGQLYGSGGLPRACG